jgi:hypothetical protein
LSYGYERALRADILEYIGDPPREALNVRGFCDLGSGPEAQDVIEEIATLVLELQSKFRVSASHGYSSEALRYGRAFKCLLQFHDSLVPQYENWYTERWGKSPVYCKLQDAEFAIADQQGSGA